MMYFTNFYVCCIFFVFLFLSALFFFFSQVTPLVVCKWETIGSLFICIYKNT